MSPAAVEAELPAVAFVAETENVDHTGEGMSLLNDFADCTMLAGGSGQSAFDANEGCLAAFATRFD